MILTGLRLKWAPCSDHCGVEKSEPRILLGKETFLSNDFVITCSDILCLYVMVFWEMLSTETWRSELSGLPSTYYRDGMSHSCFSSQDTQQGMAEQQSLHGA